MKKIILNLSDVKDHQTVHTVLDSLLPAHVKNIVPENKPNPFFKFKIHNHEAVLNSANESN